MFNLGAGEIAQWLKACAGLVRILVQFLASTAGNSQLPLLTPAPWGLDTGNHKHQSTLLHKDN
jgi:hypothetical protein